MIMAMEQVSGSLAQLRQSNEAGDYAKAQGSWSQNAR